MELTNDVLDVTMAQDGLVSADPSRRTIAQMLAMVGAAVPAASLSAEPVGRDGFSTGPSVVHRGTELSVSPRQVRREYFSRYWSEDPFHATRVADSDEIMLGTYGQPDFQHRSNPFLEYAQEVDLPHFLRVYLRSDRRLIGYLFLGRTHAQRPFSERELTFLRRAHPFLESAYAAARTPEPRLGAGSLLSEAGLTPREADVALYAATGMRTREIAGRLVVTEATVKTHLARVYRKLRVRGRAELAALLRPLGA